MRLQVCIGISVRARAQQGIGHRCMGRAGVQSALILVSAYHNHENCGATIMSAVHVHRESFVGSVQSAGMWQDGAHSEVAPFV